LNLFKFILPQSIFDFSYLFTSNLFKKFLGFCRELILAYVFGSSLIYASYLILKTLTDFLSQFTFGNALQANLLPKFSELFKKYKTLNLNEVYIYSKKVSIFLFLSSLLLQFLLIFLVVKKYYLILIFTSIILSIILSTNFINSLFLTIIQANGDFKKFSIATTFNIFVATFLIYPLSFLLNIFGVALSRLFGVFALTVKYIKPMLKDNNGYVAKISYKDLNFSVIVLANISLFILLTARFITGLNGANEITYFNYAFVLLNIVLTAFVFNINSILLRKISLNRNTKFLIYSLLVSIPLALMLYFIISNYNIQIVEFIYKRGMFNSNDVLETSFFLQSLLPSYIMLIFTSILFQPFFSMGIDKISKYSFNFLIILFSILLILTLYIFNNDLSSTDASLLFVNVMSFSALMLALFSYIIFRQDEV
jgi:peptidoglycan biosynthesis protein MviN/MurJ (putative lipid II flippase)